MRMNGLAELLTVTARWQDWTDPRFAMVVLHNRDLTEVSWEQREMEGGPRFVDSQRLPDTPYARWAKLLGWHGVRVRTPAEVDAAWREAFAADRPVLIEAMVDPPCPCCRRCSPSTRSGRCTPRWAERTPISAAEPSTRCEGNAPSRGSMTRTGRTRHPPVLGLGAGSARRRPRA